MSASELIIYLSFTPDKVQRVADFADLVRDGLIEVTSDRDVITELSTTAAAPKPMILPAVTS
jgi:hypothetical protein